MQSGNPGLQTCVIGGGGIGAALVAALAANPAVDTVYAGSRRPGGAIGKVRPFAVDVGNEASIAQAAKSLQDASRFDAVLVATGILHAEGLSPEKSYTMQSAEAYARVFAVNTTGPALVAKYFLPMLPRDRRAVFAALSARVGSISDNRLGGWHAYRASKAALNMIIRNLSIELARTQPKAIAVALHPGTVETPLSAPFQRGVAEGKLFTPEYSAKSLLNVIDGLTPEDSGKLFAWDGAEIPF
jgi:NAD(P)-dependent dehydrogenase (short-subunit alcohol dehydrogenase family)